MSPAGTINRLMSRQRPDRADIIAASMLDLPRLKSIAAAIRDQGHGSQVGYSRKVFIPLTRQCRDVCHYCTFAQSPRPGERVYLTEDEVLAIARTGAAAGCKEALFTLGDKPELRWAQARAELDEMGFATTIDYLTHVSARVLSETGLLPHLNPGVMTEADLVKLRPVAVSMGLMLETSAARLSERGGVHFGSPDKDPQVRLDCIATAGRLAIPFTSGLLIGIGETRAERLQSLFDLRDLHDRYGHLQEIIIQNFRPKPGTRLAQAEAARREDHLWTIAMARLIFGPEMTIQAPPNLSPVRTGALIQAGLNDWGGISPVTIDHVNPEAPWPDIAVLADVTRAAGKELVERLAIYPQWAVDHPRWVDDAVRPALLRHMSATGHAREDGWLPGTSTGIPNWARPAAATASYSRVGALLEQARSQTPFGEDEIVRLFAARGTEFDAVCRTADRLRRETNGDIVHYVVNRNINYTNVCVYSCSFCAFSKGRAHEHLRGTPYDLDREEFARRVAEAWDRGATEICLQGGIHPDYTGETYLDILRTARAAAPTIHIHAFSPLEIWQGASTLGLPVDAYLARLKAAGLASLPGTAAEILDDDVRRILCPDKISTAQWFEVMHAAHRLGLRSTATIMFGHVETTRHWAKHLLRVRELQIRTGGFTEFVPLPFVSREAPIFLRKGSRSGPTFREAVLMHAVARIVLHGVIPHIQTSWVKMGREGAAVCLASGADDIGGTLMNESITRAAGAIHGQEFPPAEIEAMLAAIGRAAVQRTTLYQPAPRERIDASRAAADLRPVFNRPLRRKANGAADRFQS